MVEASRWVGSQYDGGLEGRRLVVVAEAKPTEAVGLRVGRGLEAQLIPGYLDGTVKHRQFTDLARMVLGYVAERDECVMFYQRVALVNLPESFGSGAGEVTEVSWANLPRSLDSIVGELGPEDMLVLGRRLGAVVLQWSGSGAAAADVRLCVAEHPAGPGFSFRDQWAVTQVLRQASSPR